MNLFIIAASSVMALAAVFILNITQPPTWIDDLTKYKWKKISIIALIASVIQVGLNLYTSHTMPLFPALTATCSAAILTYVFAQTLITDPFLRLADRKTLFTANTICIILNFINLYTLHNNQLLTLYVIFVCVAASLILLPVPIGASDARAFLLIVASSLPTIGFDAFKICLYIMFALFVLYSVYYKIKKFGKNLTFDNIVKDPVSIPAVPIILAPFVFCFVYFFFYQLLSV